MLYADGSIRADSFTMEIPMVTLQGIQQALSTGGFAPPSLILRAFRLALLVTSMTNSVMRDPAEPLPQI